MIDPMTAALGGFGLGSALGGKGTDVKVQTTTSSNAIVSTPFNIQVSSPGSPSTSAPVSAPTSLTPNIYDEERERGGFFPYSIGGSVPSTPWTETPDTIDAGVGGFLGKIPSWAMVLGLGAVAAFVVFKKR